MTRSLLAISVLLFSGFSFGPAAQADVVINLWEDGDHVRGQASGTLDLTGLTSLGNSFFPTGFRIQPDDPEIFFFGPGDLYSGVTPFANFGPGDLDVTGTTSGDNFGFEGDRLVVPVGYQSGEDIFSEGVFFNTTLFDLGANPGTYVAILPNDTITLIVGAAPAVPEPSFAIVVLIGLGAGRLCRRGRRVY